MWYAIAAAAGFVAGGYLVHRYYSPVVLKAKAELSALRTDFNKLVDKLHI